MRTWKYETHIHTNQGSACGSNTGAEMVDYYKSLGFAGFVVTDHFIGGNTAVKLGTPWEEGIEQFCSGYEDAKRRGEEVEFDVFFGFEYAYDATEFLILGLNKKWLLENPQIIRMDLKRALEHFKKSGAFIIHAHPFRDRDYIDMIRLLPDFTDAVEVFNCANPDYVNERAAIYAKMYGFRETAGGDAHCIRSKPSGLETIKRAHTIHEFISIIQNDEYSLICTKSNV